MISLPIVKQVLLIYLFPVLAAVSFTSTSCAEEVVARYFVGDDQTVDLIASKRYGAFKVEPTFRGGFQEEVRAENRVDLSNSDLLEARNVVLVKRANGVSVEQFERALTGLAMNAEADPLLVFAEGPGDKILTDEYIIQFKPGTDDREIHAIFDKLGATVVAKSDTINNQFVITLGDRPELEALEEINALMQQSSVKYATPNFLRVYPKRHRPPEDAELDPSAFVLMSTTIWPDDFYYTVQWSLENIRAPEAWRDVTIGSCDIRMAIIDDGIDVDHDDLKDRIALTYDATNEDGVLQSIAGLSHGTWVAGVAMAMTNNDGEGVAGTAWGGEIIAIRIFGGNKHEAHSDQFDISEGINKAVAEGAHVLNNSWSFAVPMPNVTEAIENALKEDRVLIFSVGDDNDTVWWPASLASELTVIAVGATDKSDAAMPDSNYGPAVTLVAPGEDIRTTDPDPHGHTAHKYYESFGDTSAAVPHVAGAAALLLSWSPAATPYEIRTWLTEGAKDPGVNANKLGSGLLDIMNSLRLAGSDGISMNISLDSDERLGQGDETTMRVELERDGHPLSGARVKFRSLEESLVTVTPPQERVYTDCTGIAMATLEGQSDMPRTTVVIQAEIFGAAESIEVDVGH